MPVRKVGWRRAANGRATHRHEAAIASAQSAYRDPASDLTIIPSPHGSRASHGKHCTLAGLDAPRDFGRAGPMEPQRLGATELTIRRTPRSGVRSRVRRETRTSAPHEIRSRLTSNPAAIAG